MLVSVVNGCRGSDSNFRSVSSQIPFGMLQVEKCLIYEDTFLNFMFIIVCGCYLIIIKLIII